MLRRKKVLAALALLAVSAAVGWFQRTPALAWYYVRGLSKSGDGDRAAWVGRVTGLGPAALPRLLQGLRDGDAQVVRNLRAGLQALASGWGGDDPRTAALVEELVNDFTNLSPPGQAAALEVVQELVQGAPPATSAAAGRLLAAAIRVGGPPVRRPSLTLAESLLAQEHPDALVPTVRPLVQACLKDADPVCRARAARLAAHASLDLAAWAVSLLRDEVPEVRRAALAAVGPTPAALDTEELLRWLHDPDAGVRRQCEVVLRADRRLQEGQIRLGRLMTDSLPQNRLQVLDVLRRADDVEHGVWLRRLSHDPAPAVRAAAIGEAARNPDVDLTDRLEQMAQGDPSDTVRQQARYFLANPQRKPGAGPGQGR